MTKFALAAAVSVALALVSAQPAAAWHLGSTKTCLRQAFVPACGASSVAVCLARRACMLEPHKSVQVCAKWRCEPKR